MLNFCLFLTSRPFYLIIIIFILYITYYSSTSYLRFNLQTCVGTRMYIYRLFYWCVCILENMHVQSSHCHCHLLIHTKLQAYVACNTNVIFFYKFWTKQQWCTQPLTNLMRWHWINIVGKCHQIVIVDCLFAPIIVQRIITFFY